MNLKLMNKQLKKLCGIHLQSPFSTLRMRPPMKYPPNPQKGYSIIELVLVIAIIGILSITAISMLGNRTGGSVRGILDEIEGGLMDAHKFAVATGRDVTIVTRGNWTPGTPLVMARGDATVGKLAVAPYWDSAQWDKILTDLTAGQPDLPTGKGTLTNNQIASVALSFRLGTSATALVREHLHAGIAVQGSPWWGNAMTASNGKTNEDIATVEPFLSDAGFKAAITPPTLLFQNADNHVEISGASKRFNSTFVIPVVAINNGNALPGGAMGLIVVQNNGATVYKFYNPGVRNGDGKWRRI
jgi:prepilin-type N-terminal cleavage/methylation domain-containing protein